MRILFIWLQVVAVAGLCGLLPAAASAQALAWQMAVALGTPTGSSSDIKATAVDANGNVYVAGSFTGTLSIGATTFSSAGNLDVFVAKWSPASGSLIIIDNVVRDGAVSDLASTDPSVQGVHHLMELLANEPRVSATALQTVGSKGYDGFTIALVVAD